MNKQYYKSIYYNDFPAKDTKAKTLTLAFNQKEYPQYVKIKDLSNQEIRSLTEISTYNQLVKIAKTEDRSLNNILKRRLKEHLTAHQDFLSKDVTFLGSKNTPFQRWYPYIEGYSPDFVKSIITQYTLEKIDTIYDPFIGTGTTIFGADEYNITTYYSEINPLLQFIIQIKCNILKLPKIDRISLSKEIREISKSIVEDIHYYKEDIGLKLSYKTLFGSSIYFDNETFCKVLKLRTYIDALKIRNALLSDTILIAILSSLIPISLLQKSGDLRYKTRNEIDTQLKQFENYVPAKLLDFAEDISNTDYALNTTPVFTVSNAKNIMLMKDIIINAVITSPPYLNGTNYFRNTKLELWFLRYIQYEDDLRHLRDQALTSGINDVNRNTPFDIQGKTVKYSDILKKSLQQLEICAYDSRIPKMIYNYFTEMLDVFSGIYEHLSPQAKIFIDIGDSVFCDIHIPTDDILVEILGEQYALCEQKKLRTRRSRNKMLLSQTLLVFEKKDQACFYKADKYVVKDQGCFYNSDKYFAWEKDWKNLEKEIPYQNAPYSKRNWGHIKHSLCSYQGKLKPSIAYFLAKTFVPLNGKCLDPFCGVGTIPFECALNGKHNFGIDISLLGYYVSQAKTGLNDNDISRKYIIKMRDYINCVQLEQAEIEEAKRFGFNKTLSEYYENHTLKEIVLSRNFVLNNPPLNSSEMLVVSSLLHILHGNRPYALSRRSHPIVPYSPQGEYEYKNLIIKLEEKVEKTYSEPIPENFVPGKIFNMDSTELWPQEINNLDAIITSPPFFDSTRFYLANWIRLWFTGWRADDFKHNPNNFIEEKQKINFSVYENIFRQSRERLNRNGVLVLHLGKSKKCNMADELIKISKHWFSKYDLFSENVEHCESHGIRDKGTVTEHQFLILT